MIWMFAVILIIILAILFIYLALRHRKIEQAAIGGEYYDRVNYKTKEIARRLSRVKRDTRGTKLDLKEKKRGY